MALLVNQDFETPIGTTVASSYWRWVAVTVDLPTQQVLLTLKGYVDEEAFGAGKKAIGSREYRATGADFYTVGVALESGEIGLSSSIYAYVKSTDSFFSEATEV